MSLPSLFPLAYMTQATAIMKYLIENNTRNSSMPADDLNCSVKLIGASFRRWKASTFILCASYDYSFGETKNYSDRHVQKAFLSGQ